MGTCMIVMSFWAGWLIFQKQRGIRYRRCQHLDGSGAVGEREPWPRITICDSGATTVKSLWQIPIR